MDDVTGQGQTSRVPGRLAILIVNWKTPDDLLRCLAPLAPLPHHVIVVDNASDDGSAEAVTQRFPQVTLVRSSSNLGFAGGVNRARHAAGEAADMLLLLNPDTIATAEAIDALLAAFADPSIGAAGGRLVNHDGTPQTGFNIRRFPTLGSIAIDLLLIDKVWPNNPSTRRYLARDLDAGPDAVPVDVDQPAAACLMVRASVFDAIDGMDERFHPAWFEDVDFCRRLRAAGYRIRFEPRAKFAHRGAVAKGTLGPTRFESIWYANMERYVRRHHGKRSVLLLKGLILVGMVFRIGGSLVRRDATAAPARAYAAVLKQTVTRWPR